MNKKIEANVILCKCNNHQTFGIRVQKVGNDWLRTWAFPISDKTAKREQYDNTRIRGSFNETEEYEGCPYCHTHSFFTCGACGRMNCYDGEASVVTCAWCGNTGELTTAEQFDVDSNDY